MAQHHPERIGASIPGGMLGTHLVTKAHASGLFVCPAESTARAYWHISVRSWTTFFSIPLIPGRMVEEYVECFSCGSKVHPSVVGSDHPSLQPPA